MFKAIKTPKRRQWRRSGVFIVNFKHITDHWNSKLLQIFIVSFFNILENLQDNQQKNFLSGIFSTFKSKLQRIHAALINVF